MSDLQVAIVIPCYDEAKRLQYDQFHNFLQQSPQLHLCFVNDGSKDDTLNILQQLHSQNLQNTSVVNLEINQGKAHAVRAGISYLLAQDSFDLLGFWDADLSTPLEEISCFMEKISQTTSIKMVLGCRVQRLGANVQRKPHRHILGRIFAICASRILKMPVYDTQCGAKMFTSKLAEKMFDRPFYSKWFFDIELLFRAREYIQQKENWFYEYPLSEWIHKDDSKIKFKDVILTPFELLKLFWCYRISKKFTGPSV